MPVTAEQAQMLTTLAIACRPYGARRWDAAGVMANIRKVADRDLATVMIAVAQAAEDRKAETPGVIAAAGPHWRAPDPSRPTRTAPDTWEPDDICTTCSRPSSTCEARRTVGDDDHEFVSRATNAAATARPFASVQQIVGDLRERKAAPAPTVHPEHHEAAAAAEEASA